MAAFVGFSGVHPPPWLEKLGGVSCHPPGKPPPHHPHPHHPPPTLGGVGFCSPPLDSFHHSVGFESSTWQLAEQPSLSSVLPSSHCSPSSIDSLPHTASAASMRQSSEHQSLLPVLPSSHCSQVSTEPLPHTAVSTSSSSRIQDSLQCWFSPTPSLPSHCSSHSLIPLPQLSLSSVVCLTLKAIQ